MILIGVYWIPKRWILKKNGVHVQTEKNRRDFSGF